MRFKQSLLAALMLGIGVSSTFAANVAIKGTIPGEVKIHPSRIYGLTSAPSVKHIVFERVVLSPAAQSYLAKHIDMRLKMAGVKAKSTPLVPEAAQLGMNNVPVLDQGQHGTCVTFAVTGAIDATIDEGKQTGGYDRYSQLCSLELGSTLESESPIDPDSGEHTYPSGWDGSWATLVLGQIDTHGLISKEYQQTKGCAGVREYPLMIQWDRGRAMSKESYDSNSEKVLPPVSYQVIMNPDDAFTDKVNTDDVLAKVKTALVAKHRITFGTLLDVKYGENGAVGTYKVPNDTWILSAQIAKDAKHPESIQAGHEMIITGYDDNAEVNETVSDDNGEHTVVHKGVLTLRNSWGVYAGDSGNYYMTYDHFKALVLEVAEYIPATTSK